MCAWASWRICPSHCRKIKRPVFDFNKTGEAIKFFAAGWTGEKVPPRQKIFSNCSVALIERNMGAKLATQKEWQPSIFAAYSRPTSWTMKLRSGSLTFRAASPPLQQSAVRWRKGEFAICRAFALRGGGREQNMNGGGEKKTLQKMKTSVERQLVQYNQLWHKYWMNADRECRVDVKRSGPHSQPRIMRSPRLIWPRAKKHCKRRRQLVETKFGDASHSWTHPGRCVCSFQRVTAGNILGAAFVASKCYLWGKIKTTGVPFSVRIMIRIDVLWLLRPASKGRDRNVAVAHLAS